MAGVRRWVLAAAVLALGATTLVVDVPVDAADRTPSSTYGATVVHYSVSSRLLGRRLDEAAIVPPGDGPRPLLVLLHGRHDRPPRPSGAPSTSGPESMLSNALFTAVAALGERAPVVVLLNGGRHTWYHDRRYGRWGSMILDEAIPNAIRRFHAQAEPIAIGGFSMGGYGALHLAALRPSEFCAVGAHSAALYETAGASPEVAFDNAGDFARNDVYKAARLGRFKRLPVWIDGGSDDPFRDADAAFASVLRAHGVRVTYHVWPGAHTASYWNAHMADYLAFYASELAQCRGPRAASG